MATRMTRASYRLVAGVLADMHTTWPDTEDAKHEVVEETARRLADAFEQDNPYFNRQLFLRAAEQR